MTSEDMSPERPLGLDAMKGSGEKRNKLYG